MTILVLSTKINEATISLMHLHLEQVASTPVFLNQLICTWPEPTKVLGISQTSHSCIDFDKIVL